jgi:hypothetical protein
MITRKDFLLGAAAALLAGCTPVRILVRDYPAGFDRSPVAERILRRFVTTVIPGADGPHLARAFTDSDYPFAPYAPFFAHDLATRALRLGATSFEALEPRGRVAVVQAGLDGDATTRKLYRAAIFLAQVSFYAGIYDDAAGCDLIEFQGARELVPRAQQRHAQPERFFGRALTGDGNYA